MSHQNYKCRNFSGITQSCNQNQSGNTYSGNKECVATISVANFFLYVPVNTRLVNMLIVNKPRVNKGLNSNEKEFIAVALDFKAGLPEFPHKLPNK